MNDIDLIDSQFILGKVVEKIGKQTIIDKFTKFLDKPFLRSFAIIDKKFLKNLVEISDYKEVKILEINSCSVKLLIEPKSGEPFKKDLRGVSVSDELKVGQTITA